MKLQTLTKILKTLKVIRIVQPLLVLLLGAFMGVALLEKDAGKPGGDPIDDDPVPI